MSQMSTSLLEVCVELLILCLKYVLPGEICVSVPIAPVKNTCSTLVFEQINVVVLNVFGEFRK